MDYISCCFIPCGQRNIFDNFWWFAFVENWEENKNAPVRIVKCPRFQHFHPLQSIHACRCNAVLKCHSNISQIYLLEHHVLPAHSSRAVLINLNVSHLFTFAIWEKTVWLINLFARRTILGSAMSTLITGSVWKECRLVMFWILYVEA